jgi:hypothetical protein
MDYGGMSDREAEEQGWRRDADSSGSEIGESEDQDWDDAVEEARLAEARDWFPDVEVEPTELPITNVRAIHGTVGEPLVDVDEQPTGLPITNTRAVDSRPEFRRVLKLPAEVPEERRNPFGERARDFVYSSMESLAWRVAELIAAHSPLGPILGPVVVKALYLSKQVFTAFDGLAEGNGFYLEAGISLDQLDGKGLLHGQILPPVFSS